ncbi:acyl-CoA dehydrogenase [Noviherbaspirillum saxi]|uniref:Acyl-CoA dehydrogenase n=1 Tax=Noviherbaspirillum saxi TaxID=2320863 RepID=A0A3A3FJF9_9BURK|nr:acyl-CoA dehydrogenase [Noviherbaspirillum saxi]RJF95427.1 acyl-CoA dehydrogenase [Noviherbaspirillum saxi]
MDKFIHHRNLEFLLYELLDTEALLQRPRYHEQSRDVYDSILETARNIARKYLAPHYQKGDANEPEYVDGTTRLIPETKVAWDVIRDAGFLAAHCDEAEGGLQLPEVIFRSATAYFHAANGPTTWYPFLTIGVINLIRAFGSQEQKERYLGALMEGRFAGTMALTEPGQGSALADIKTRAELQDDGTWRIFGQKMFISAGEHDLTGNIIHMVLAKTKGAPPGVKGISLFIVPKFVVGDDGVPGARNDVALAGLLHKMGSRNTSSTVLSFGEKGGAVGYLIGGIGSGLACMFQMMNEARIGVGMNAAALASRGYLYSLDYARDRSQGRLPSNKDPVSPQVPLVAHPDVRRMLLAQKAYAEGALALCLYASSLFEDEHTHPDESRRVSAGVLLGLLTPVVKSWSARYGCEANELAIQVLGGSGYIREHPVEQLYRDQRLNPIHEGAEGIHGIDLLARKVTLRDGEALRLFTEQVRRTGAEAEQVLSVSRHAHALRRQLDALLAVTDGITALARNDPDKGLANATVYLDAFGRVTVAWLWLSQGLVAARALEGSPNDADRLFYKGKLQAAAYYFDWELPQVEPQWRLLTEGNSIPYDMMDTWY